MSRVCGSVVGLKSGTASLALGQGSGIWILSPWTKGDSPYPERRTPYPEGFEVVSRGFLPVPLLFHSSVTLVSGSFWLSAVHL